MATAQLGIKGNNAVVPYVSATKRTKALSNVLTFSSTPSGWSVIASNVVFYADSAGVWRMVFNISATINSASSGAFTIDGVAFKNTTNFLQAMSGAGSGAFTVYPTVNTGTINFVSTTNTTGLHISGDVVLNAEPTTYTTAANMEGVIAADVYIPNATDTSSGLIPYYKTGTWTPIFTMGSGTITSYTSAGTYTRIGNVVTISCSGLINDVGTGSAQGIISNLPYTIGAQGASGCTRIAGTTGSTCSITGGAGTSVLILYTYNNGSPWTTNASFIITLSYIVN